MSVRRSGIMSYICRCPGCGRAFNTKQGRAVHERIVHENVLVSKNSDYKCPYCEKSRYFETEIGLQIHLDEEHGIKSQFLDWVENRSFENLVYMYNDELYKIKSENLVSGILQERELTKLLREGVLAIDEYGRMGKHTMYRLTDEAQKVLSKLNIKNKETIS